MHYIIYGAGGIGGTIGGRLHQAGLQTTLIARGEHGRELQSKGLRLIGPDGAATLDIPTVTHPREVSFDDEAVVLLCMKSQHTQAALDDLAIVAPAHVAVACVQNGVANERLALRYFENVYATVVNLPALYLTPGEVVTYAKGAGGVLDTGHYPRGIDDLSIQLTADLTAAGFSARPDPEVMRFKYAKLLMNLFNVLQAGLTDPQNMGPLRRQIRNEALACFSAAGIECADADEVRERQRDIYEVVDVAGHLRTAGSTWQSIERGTGDIETDYLNGEICLLGRLHGIPTPANDACVSLARTLLQTGSGPGLMSVAQFIGTIRDA